MKWAAIVFSLLGVGGIVGGIWSPQDSELSLNFFQTGGLFLTGFFLVTMFWSIFEGWNSL